MSPTAVERVTEALVQHVSARLERRRHLEEVFATARRENEEIRRTGGRLSGLSGARRAWQTMREHQEAQTFFDSTRFAGLVAEARGTDAESADHDLYRAAWHLESLAGVHLDGLLPLAAEVEDLRPAEDDLPRAARLLAEWVLEPDGGPVHERLGRAQALWRALERGQLLALKPGSVLLLLSPHRSTERTRRRVALMRLSEARGELLEEWRRILAAA